MMVNIITFYSKVQPSIIVAKNDDLYRKVREEQVRGMIEIIISENDDNDGLHLLGLFKSILKPISSQRSVSPYYTTKATQ